MARPGRGVPSRARAKAKPKADLDRQFPGLWFRVVDEQDRIRPHMRLFVNGEQVFDLARAVADTDEVAIVQALSGG